MRPRSIALPASLAFTLLATLSWSGPAPAQEEPSPILDLEPEFQESDGGVSFTATVTDEMGNPLQVNVDFSIGAQNDGDSSTVDVECDTDPAGTCTVTFPEEERPRRSGASPVVVPEIAWVDLDGDDAIPGEADTGEGVDEGSAPGDVEEPDLTDVVRVQHGGQPFVQGTHGNDILIGTDAGELILARGGNDLVRARGGPDRVVGGPGDDLLVGGRGADLLRGAGGRDTLRGGPGADLLDGGPGVDLGNGGPGRDDCAAERLRSCETGP